LLRINLKIHLPYLLIYPAQRSRDPQIDFFPEIIGQQVSRIDIVPFDKLVQLFLGHHALHMSFFGRQPNILLVDENKQICGTFKKKFALTDEKKNEYTVKPDQWDQQKFLIGVQQNTHFPLLDFLNRYLAGFNTLLSRELCHRCNLEPDLPVSRLTNSHLEQLRQNCTAMITEMGQQPARIYSDRQRPLHLSILTLNHLENHTGFQIYPDLNTAWQQFVYYYQRQLNFNQLSARLTALVQNRLDYLRRSMDSMLSVERLEQRKRDAELKGNLLLIHAARIPKGTKVIELENIFSTSAEPLRIKLNPAKTVQQNAHNYFEKYKNLDQKKINLSIRRDTLLHEFTYWQEISVRLEHLTALPQLEKIKKELIERGSLPGSNSGDERGQTLAYSFRRLVLGGRWQVFIGKNARNNELLTFKYANKFDFWFHAQGVSGSHVVLRLDAKNNQPPVEIMEQAAAVAAFFSSAKHSRLVPVNYTRVCHVRKIRNQPVGTVMIAQEKTLLVKPQKFA
jgi:predicted ribosome quality control (RQC) complex YloA/Tae2 family protein